MEGRRGKLRIIGLGPGNTALLTGQARAALDASDVMVGYRTYVDLIRGLVEGKEVLAGGMRQEVERARLAIERAAEGQSVSLVSSGDPGIYGMAGLVFEVLRERGWPALLSVDVEVVPGVAALSAAASLLGAPLMHDFASISLSDLLTPWEVIAKRVDLAAQGDFVIVLYNPRSTQRTRQLVEAHAIIARHRAPATPVGIVRNAYRDGQQVIVTDLRRLIEHPVDMVTLIVIGNSTTFSFEGLMVTPRGYGAKYDFTEADVG